MTTLAAAHGVILAFSVQVFARHKGVRRMCSRWKQTAEGVAVTAAVAGAAVAVDASYDGYGSRSGGRRLCHR